MSKVLFDFKGYSRDELKHIADSIYRHLNLSKTLNLEDELIEHYQRCKGAAEIAYRELEMGNSTAGTAAVLASTTGALKELARLQTDLYNADRLKQLERVFIDVLKQFDGAEEVLKRLKQELNI